ncbi:ATP-binding cassette, subfamily B [Oceanospirillum multiglobuliferum]|uniref:Metal ABC transporter permease n=1 Tax=Oceanospirillum multiglobuliferum TaxID=64969 RepID=A0A1T4PTX7_9GAMM|nr:ABC transporter ATP-binding protein/permease [Oceanospirillum multiglobuliferum]OPX55316.1 metal ABC transporter permease [Oceanospirillum multiglobuliferum]SJZ95022.1 ATP-binding cassette, subfamily B [Oceanospirillum multiglobuliferum]
MRHHHSVVEPGTGMKWHVLKMLWPYLLEFRYRVFAAIACLVLAKVASVSLPYFLKHIVDGLNTATLEANALIIAPLGLVAAYGAARFLNVIMNEVRDTLFGRVTERTIRRISLKTFQHLHHLDLDFHLNRRTGGLSRDIERGTSGISFLMRFMIFNIVPTLLEVMLVVGILFYHYGVTFAAITLFSVLCYVVFSIVATEWRTRYLREVNEADTASNSRAVDSLLNYETVKYFTNEAYEAKRYDDELALWESAKRKNRLTLFALNGGQALIIALAMTSMLALASIRVANDEMTLGDFVLINAFMMQLFIPLNFLGFVYREIKGSLANIEQMFELLKRQPKVVDAPQAQVLPSVQGAITFNNVSFHYQAERPILNNISFTVEPGQKVAVVGESGSGKSTLVKLLFRFYDPTEGEICIDDQAIQQLTQQSLRQAIGIVPQDTVLFNNSILENVRYGRPSASDEEVMNAISMAHLDQFIQDLPKGVQTLVGERGLKLSGGEKQRIAIARAILKRPPILVFDEATSSLDSKSEQAILKAMKEIAEGYTSLVIAHRLSTIVDADKIIVLHQGVIVEEGSHNSLLAQQGVYANLWQIQQQKSDAEGER